jgi:transcriptional regulator with GAF, ATPase, and Fis domain
VERAVIRARTGALQFELPRDGEIQKATSKVAVEVKHDPKELLTEADLRQRERENMLAVLQHHQWKISGPGGAAEFLGIHPATLSSRLQVMGIQRPR